MSSEGSGARRPLNRDRVLRAAVALADTADTAGIDALSMRNLARELGVVPMALYKHVANKEELLDGMVEVIVGEIDPPVPGADWKDAIRRRILSARRALLRHRWASLVIESRTAAPPVVLAYLDSLSGMFLAGGFSVDLTHHVMHALGSRMWGFTQQVFPIPSPPADPALREAQFRQGCDDQFEFEFALDVLLDGFERLHRQRWSSTGPQRGARTAG